MEADPGPRCAGDAHGCARAARLLDPLTDNCALPPVLEPVFSRSAWDQQGGGKARYEARERVMQGCLSAQELAEHEGLRPLAVTLTLSREWDRDQFPTEADAARHALRKFSVKLGRLFTLRLRAKYWCRVVEFHTNSGPGWPHWHALVWFEKGVRAQVFGARVKESWASVGGGHVHVKAVPRKDVEREIGYMVKYMCKSLHTVPPMLDHPDVVNAPRSYAMSSQMSALVPRPRPTKHLKAPRRRPTRVPFYQRIVESGLSAAVVRERVDSFTGEAKPQSRSKPMPLPRKGLVKALEAGILGEQVPAARKVHGFRYEIPGGAEAFERFCEEHRAELEAWYRQGAESMREQLRHRWYASQPDGATA
jgi:hypothetical protein